MPKYSRFIQVINTNYSYDYITLLIHIDLTSQTVRLTLGATVKGAQIGLSLVIAISPKYVRCED